MRPDPNASPISPDEYAAELEARSRRWEAGKLVQQQGCDLEPERHVPPADYTPRWNPEDAAAALGTISVNFARTTRVQRRKDTAAAPVKKLRGAAVRAGKAAADTARPVVADAAGQVLMFSEEVRA